MECPAHRCHLVNHMWATDFQGPSSTEFIWTRYNHEQTLILKFVTFLWKKRTGRWPYQSCTTPCLLARVNMYFFTRNVKHYLPLLARWLISIIPALREAMTAEFLEVQDQSGTHSELQNSLGCVYMRSCPPQPSKCYYPKQTFINLPYCQAPSTSVEICHDKESVAGNAWGPWCNWANNGS